MRRMEDGMSEQTQNTKELAAEVLKAEKECLRESWQHWQVLRVV